MEASFVLPLPSLAYLDPFSEMTVARIDPFSQLVDLISFILGYHYCNRYA